jgi:hypothetical protein
MTNKLDQSTAPTRATRTKTAMLASVIIGAMVLPFVAPVQTVKANNDRQEGSEGVGNPEALAGTWVVQEALNPQTVPPGTLLSFTRLETYSAGGGYVATNNGPGAGGPPSQGNWVAVGHGEFATTELRLGFDAANVFTGITKIRSQLTINEAGNEFTGSVQVDIFLPNGVLLPSHPAGTFHGTRLPIEPLH